MTRSSGDFVSQMQPDVISRNSSLKTTRSAVRAPIRPDRAPEQASHGSPAASSHSQDSTPRAQGSHSRSRLPRLRSQAPSLRSRPTTPRSPPARPRSAWKRSETQESRQNPGNLVRFPTSPPPLPGAPAGKTQDRAPCKTFPRRTALKAWSSAEGQRLFLFALKARVVPIHACRDV